MKKKRHTNKNKSSGKPINMHISLVNWYGAHKNLLASGETNILILCAFIIITHSLTIFGFEFAR